MPWSSAWRRSRCRRRRRSRASSPRRGLTWSREGGVTFPSARPPPDVDELPRRLLQLPDRPGSVGQVHREVPAPDPGRPIPLDDPAVEQRGGAVGLERRGLGLGHRAVLPLAAPVADHGSEIPAPRTARFGEEAPRREGRQNGRRRPAGPPAAGRTFSPRARCPAMRIASTIRSLFPRPVAASVRGRRAGSGAARSGPSPRATPRAGRRGRAGPRHAPPVVPAG